MFSSHPHDTTTYFLRMHIAVCVFRHLVGFCGLFAEWVPCMFHFESDNARRALWDFRSAAFSTWETMTIPCPRPWCCHYSQNI